MELLTISRASPPACARPQGFGTPKRHNRSAPQSAERKQRTLSLQTEAAVDGNLIRRFNGGDETAFEEIVTRYRDKILAIAGQFLKNHWDAEEITQDTFIRAHRGLGRFRGEASLATWLHCIAVNLARNRYWYFFRRRRHLTLSLDCPLGSETDATFSDLVATDDPDPARQASVDEFVRLVSACMEKLDDSHREILTMRNVLHLQYDEIARTLGINDGTVKSRIARARAALRKLLAETRPEFRLDLPIGEWFEPARRLRGVA